MEGKKEQALVGLFVLIATGILIATLFAISGAFGRAGASYRASFKFAGGLEPGAVVRYGGIRAGRVEQLRVDPQDPSRIEITFTIAPGIPVKTDSVAQISYLGALGDNYMEIKTGSKDAPLAASGAKLASEEYVSFADVATQLTALGPEAQTLVKNLNQRVVELQETIMRVNDLLNEANRANVSASLGNVRGMLEENRPTLRRTMANVEEISAKAKPLVDDLRKTIADAEGAIKNIDAVVGENREDVRKAVEELRRTLAAASGAVEQIDRLLVYNAENIDEALENIRIITENLKQFTDTIKTRPYTLIRATRPPERKPGQPPKQ